MACRGVFFALKKSDAARLLRAKSDEEVLEIIQEDIEEEWDEKWLSETDKAWDAMHRCLGDGTLSHEPLTTLHKCVLGGKQLYQGEDYIISFLPPEDVKEVAAAILPLDEAFLRQRYFALDLVDYDSPLTEEDFECTWENFKDAKALFQKAAKAGRAVVFTVDQ